MEMDDEQDGSLVPLSRVREQRDLYLRYKGRGEGDGDGMRGGGGGNIWVLVGKVYPPALCLVGVVVTFVQ